MKFNVLNLLIVVGVFMVPLALTFWAILDLPKRRFSSAISKVLWFAVVASLPGLGAVLYLLFARRKTEPLKGVSPSVSAYFVRQGNLPDDGNS